MIDCKDAARQQGIADVKLLDSFFDFAWKQKTIPVKKKIGSVLVDEADGSRLVELWLDQNPQLRSDVEEYQFLAAEEARIEAVSRAMPVTSGAGFEGYRITHYGGYVSGDEAIKLSDSWFSGASFSKDSINDAIKAIRVTAIKELKVAAADIGCNAVIGLDFDYVTIDRQKAGIVQGAINETYLILTANGTAVTIEPL